MIDDSVWPRLDVCWVQSVRGRYYTVTVAEDGLAVRRGAGNTTGAVVRVVQRGDLTWSEARRVLAGVLSGLADNDISTGD